MTQTPTLQAMFSPIIGNTGAFYLSDVVKNSISYMFLELSGIIDMIMEDSSNPILNNLKVGLSFSAANEGVRVVNRGTSILNMDKANFVRFVDNASFSALAMVLISNFNFDEIALDLLEKFNLPLNGAQLKSLLAGILMTVISLLRQIIQRTPQLSSLTALTNPVLTMSSSMPVGGGNSLN